jgi:hypothetical protein
MNWKSAGGAILLVGLMLLSGWINALETENWLQEEPTTRYLVASDSLTADTQTNSSLPTMTYGSTDNLMIGEMSNGNQHINARMLASFDLTVSGGGQLPTTAVIHEATLELTCRKFSMLPNGGSILYPAMLLTEYNESNANYNQSNTSTPWNVTGADGVGSDRGEWEPGTMASISSVSSVTLNITALVQEAFRNGQSNMSLIISGIGMPVYCASSDHPTSSNRPSLDFTYTLGAPSTQGSVVITGPTDGSILSDSSQLAIRPNLNPTITWSNLSTSALDIQFSNGPDFRAISDGDWHWTSWDDAGAFSMSNGQFNTPNTNLSDGSWVYFRMRSAEVGSLGPWVSGYFGLPGNLGDDWDGSNNVEIVLKNDSVGLGLGTVHDTWVLSGNSTYNGNDDLRLRIGHSNDSTEGDMHAFIRVNMGSVALNNNVTIEDATLNVRRTSRGEVMLSAWVMDSATGMVFEELNYNNSSTGASWNNGGIGNISEDALLTLLDGNQSTTSTLTFDATPYIQQYLRDGRTGDLDFIIMAHGPNGEEIEIATGDEPPSYRPHLDLSYTWGDSTATPSPGGITPLDGNAAWDEVGWGLESTTTPALTWDPSVASHSNGNPADVIIEFFEDDFHELPIRVDSREDSGFDLTNGEYTIPSFWGLEWGQMYDWRMMMVEDDEQGPWVLSEFLISEINSTSLGGGEHELRYSHGNATPQSGWQLPHCGDLTLESGSSSTNLDGQDITVSNSQVILIGCQLDNHQLPDGLAVVSATLRVKTHQYSGLSSLPVGITVHESAVHDWDESAATWNTTDGTTPWNVAGASGSDRIQALESQDVEYDDTWYEWNVTGAVQNAMRTHSLVDFIMTSQSTTSVTFYDRLSSHRPELVIIYTNGSNAAPATPTDLTPGNGDWVISGDSTFTVDQTPTLSWNGTSTPPANGWQVQVDTTSTFGSSGLLNFASWIDTSSFTGATFTFPNDLGEGEAFHWRARGISATGQIGQWSAGTSFVIPDLDVNQVDSDTYKVNMGHGDILSDGSMPLFTDTWISWASPSLNDTHADESTLFISSTSSVLIQIPIDGPGALPHPSNGRLVGAHIDFWVQSNNSSTPSIAIYETLQDWNESATGQTYDGVTNWSTVGGNGVQDRSDWISVVVDQAASSRMIMDITEIVQAAIARGDDSVGLMLSVESNSNDRIVLASTETQFDANEPEISLTWQNGSATAPTQAATILYPANGDIIWEHPSMSADDSPLASWSHPSTSGITDWRVFAYTTDAGPWDGVAITDSRTCSNCNFDMTNLTLDDSDVGTQDARYSWLIQPIQNGMYGPRSAVEDFIVPNDIGDVVNSTDYWVALANGNAYSSTSSYDVAQGAYMDSCNANSAFGNYNSALPIGASNGGSTCVNNGHESRTLMRFDVSNVPIMDNDPWQIIDATVKMYRYGGSSNYNTDISVSNVHCNWDEASVTWNDCATNNSWQTSGAYGVNDADMPIEMTTVGGNGWYSWNVTQLMQDARISGSDTLNLVFSSEDSNLYARHSFVNEHATGVNQEYRPILNITYRAGTQSMPAAPSWDSGLTSNSPSTAWDSSALRPTPQDPLMSGWTHPSASTVDGWQIQVAKNNRFTSDTWVLDSSDSTTWNNVTFDIVNQSISTPASVAQGDHWNHLRVRAVQDGVYSNWSAPFAARVPDEQGSDDGAGNYTVTMQRGAVFVDSGYLPTMPDTWIGSNAIGQYQNHGSSYDVAVGVDPSSPAHDAVGLVSIDLSEYPYPATMLPTAVTLRMYVGSISGTGAHSIAIHDCSGFTESTTTWNNYNPNTQCNATVASSMTATSSASGVWYEWDVTSIARSAWSGNGVMSMALKTAWSGTVYFASAESGSTYAPELIVDYVDNPSNASSPAQVSLISPQQLEVVYDVDLSNNVLGVDSRPMLTWGSLADATGYVLLLSNASGTQEYKSWDSNSNSGFGPCGTSTCSWTSGFDLATGEIYTWSVQALNDSVPGPRSVPWTFGIGNPDITNVGNHVYTIQMQEGADVEDIGHMPIWDTYISEGATSEASGDDDTLHIGTGCDGASSNRCYGIYQVDMGQMGPLGMLPVNTHSAQLSIYAEGVSDWSLASHLDLTAYAVINSNFDEGGATWDSAATGINWTTAGLQAGVDYSTIALDTMRVTPSSIGTGTWLHFDISGALSTMTGTVTIIIMGTPNAGKMLLDITTSEESSTTALRPVILFNYTIVDSITVTGPSTTDADTPISFTGTLLAANGASLTGGLTWTSSSGSIDSSGYFTPDQTGVTQITASYGQVSQTLNVTVTAGTPIALVVTPLSITMTADDVFTLDQIRVIDANGNVVPGETITLEISNGTLSTGLTLTTPVVSSVSWTPWTAGTQYMNVTWGSVTHTIPITVNVGAPDYFIIVGSPTIEAGNTTSYSVDVFDQRGNQMDSSLSGTLTWGAPNGAMDNSSGAFTGDLVGPWTIWVDSDLGIHSEFVTTVVYGDISDLKVTAVGPSATIIMTSTPTTDSIAMTADNIVTFSLLRIDVQGNEEPFDLPISGWTWSNGTMTAGPPSVWDAWANGPQWVKATLEGVEVTISMSVDHGVPVAVEARTVETILVSGDIAMTLNAYASDSDYNQWSIAADDWTITTSGADPTWLQGLGSFATFEPIIVGDWNVRMIYTFVGASGSQSYFDDVTFTVMPGTLRHISVTDDATITADDTHALSPGATDMNLNVLPVTGLNWFEWNNANGAIPSSCSVSQGWSDITTEMRASNYVWDATSVGTYTICASGGTGSSALPAMSEVTVTVGIVDSVWHMAYLGIDESGDSQNMSSTTITAGDAPFVEIWVADADGNPFRATITWSSDSVSDFTESAHLQAQSGIGDFRFIGSKNQVYTLTYSAGECSACTGTWTVDVDAGGMSKLRATASSPDGQSGSKLTVEQQTKITISVVGFDAYDNEVPISLDGIFIQEDADNLNIVKQINETTYEIYMLNEGMNTIYVMQGTTSANPPPEIQVEGTIAGFFEANSPWSWVGLGFVALLFMGVIMVVVLLARRGNSGDDEYDEDLYDDEPEYSDMPAGPSGTSQASEPVHEEYEEEYSAEEDPNYKVDEDGTEWWEDDEGTWWYREPGMDDWAEWKE